MRGLDAARGEVFRATRDAFTRAEPLTVSQWAAKERRVAGRGNPEPGPWRNERTPYLVGVMDAVNDPSVDRISFMKAERVGGSEALLNILGWIIRHDPSPTLLIWPTEDIARRVMAERILPTLRSSPALAAEMTGRPRDVQALEVRLRRMTVRAAGSNSESALELFGYKYVVPDELDRCAEGLLSIVEGRGATFSGAKLICASTPELEGRGIDAEFHAGDRRRFHVPCPHCRAYHLRRFAGVKWFGDLEASPADVLERAYFVCPAEGCGRPIHGHHNAWQLERGVWVPEGCRAEAGPDGPVIVGTPVNGGTRHASFALSGLYTPFKRNPYGYAAAEFVRAGGRPTREWVNRRLGEPWSTKGQRVEASELSVLCTPRGQGGYLPGTVPHDVLALTCACDVQTDRVWYEILGWTREGRRAYLIEWGKVARAPKDGLRGLTPLLLRVFRAVDLSTGQDRGERVISHAFIDSGHFTDEVYGFVRGRERGGWSARAVAPGPGAAPGAAAAMVAHGPALHATKGYYSERAAGGVSAGMSEPHKFTWPEKITGVEGKGAPRPDGVRVLLVNTGYHKRALFDELRANLRSAAWQRDRLLALADRAAGRQHDREAIDREIPPRTWLFPEGTEKAYFDQLTAEEEVRRVVNGRVVTAWRPRPGMPDNHLLDCRVLNLAGARAEGVHLLGAGPAAPAAAAEPGSAGGEERRIAARDERPREGWMSRGGLR